MLMLLSGVYNSGLLITELLAHMYLFYFWFPNLHIPFPFFLSLLNELLKSLNLLMFPITPSEIPLPKSALINQPIIVLIKFFLKIAEEVISPPINAPPIPQDTMSCPVR